MHCPTSRILRVRASSPTPNTTDAQSVGFAPENIECYTLPPKQMGLWYSTSDTARTSTADSEAPGFSELGHYRMAR